MLKYRNGKFYDAKWKVVISPSVAQALEIFTSANQSIPAELVRALYLVPVAVGQTPISPQIPFVQSKPPTTPIGPVGYQPGPYTDDLFGDAEHVRLLKLYTTLRFPAILHELNAYVVSKGL